MQLMKKLVVEKNIEIIQAMCVHALLCACLCYLYE